MSTENIEAIKQLKSRYFRSIDTKQWDDFENLFTDEAEMDMSGELERYGGNPEDGRVKGKATIRNFVESAVKDAITVHHGHTPEIQIVEPEKATGIWAMQDIVNFGTPEEPAGISGYGHYHESYEKLADGKWYISKLKLIRLTVMTLE